MGKKAKADHTPEPPPLDDDAHWRPIEPAHQRLTERFHDTAFSPIIELMKALADGRLHCMARSATGEQRKLFAPAAWVDQIKLDLTSNGVRVIYGQPLHQAKPGGYAIVNPVRGWRFYFWKPDFDRIWPPPADSAPVEHDNASDEPPRVKPGPKPYKDWPKRVAQWLIEVAVDDPQKLQNVDELVAEAKIILHNRIKWAPKQNKELRAYIVDLLEPVRR